MLATHPSHNYFGILLFWNRSYVLQLAGEVARQCRAGLYDQVNHRTANMSLPEIRGYLRALASASVPEEVDQLLERRALKPTLRAKVIEVATDQLINMVAHDVFSGEAPYVARTMAA
jgi:hypothetical protein